MQQIDGVNLQESSTLFCLILNHLYTSNLLLSFMWTWEVSTLLGGVAAPMVRRVDLY